MILLNSIVRCEKYYTFLQYFFAKKYNGIFFFLRSKTVISLALYLKLFLIFKLNFLSIITAVIDQVGLQLAIQQKHL